jgi:hypothetical protein
MPPLARHSLLYAIALGDTGYLTRTQASSSDTKIDSVTESAVLNHVPRSFETGGNVSVGVGSERFASGKILII